MPMDIRMFFAKKGGSSSSTTPTTNPKKLSQPPVLGLEKAVPKATTVAVARKKGRVAPKDNSCDATTTIKKKNSRSSSSNITASNGKKNDESLLVAAPSPLKKQKVERPKSSAPSQHGTAPNDVTAAAAANEMTTPTQRVAPARDGKTSNEPSSLPRKQNSSLGKNVSDSTNTGDDDDDCMVVDEDPLTTVASSPTKQSSSRQCTNPPSITSTKQQQAKVPSRRRDPPLKLTMKQQRDSFQVDTAMAECLLGYTFCVTGVFASTNFSRDDAQDFIKSLGGRVTTAVSGKTDYLVVGDSLLLEDGRPYQEGSKYKRAMQEGPTKVILVMGEKALYGLAQQYDDKARATRKPPPSPVAATAVGVKSAAAQKSPPTATSAAKPVSNPYAARVAVNPYAKANPYVSKPSAISVSGQISAATHQGASIEQKKNINNNNNMLWVEKYKPTSSQEILGNQDCVRKLSQWLKTWEHTFNNAKAIGKSFSAPNGPWKAALLSGPPGIGKSTTAALVAAEAGRDVIEYNASDVRSKKALQSEMGDVTGSHTLEFSRNVKNGSGKKAAARTRRCLIMDEVDGMGAGDRSGMAELIQMIKHSRVPIICICNDRQAQKIKSLVPYCMDLRYRRPLKSLIANRVMAIAKKEGFSVESNAAEAIAESCGNDVRQVVNSLQMWASNAAKDSRMTYKGVKDRERSVNKDEILRVSLFDAARLILEGRKGLSNTDGATERDHFFRRNDAFFVDYGFIGLLVQQNYLKVMQGQFNDTKRSNDRAAEVKVLDRMHDAAASMSDYALAEEALRGGQNWSLLPFTGVLTVKTGFHAGGETGGMLPGFPEFTAWLGKNSSKGKKTRLLHELQHHMNYKVSGGTQEMRMSYVPVFHSRILSLLSSAESDAIEEAITLMDEYGLSRDDVFEKLDEFKLDKKEGSFNDLDSKRKATFTRTYNQMTHKSQALVAEQGGGKKTLTRKGGSAMEGESADYDAINDDKVEDVEEDDDDELDDEKIKALFKPKGRKTSASDKKDAPKKAMASKKTIQKKKAK
jgi:replication factor C subunit 1